MKRLSLCAFVALLTVASTVPDATSQEVESAAGVGGHSTRTRLVTPVPLGPSLLGVHGSPPPTTIANVATALPNVATSVVTNLPEVDRVEARDPAPISAVETVAYNPTPVQRAMDRLAELGANAEQLRFFDCLMWFESNYRWWVTSPWGDRGLLQINYIHAWRYVGRDIFDPVVNAEVAWDIYRESGFKAWSAAKFCYR